MSVLAKQVRTAYYLPVKREATEAQHRHMTHWGRHGCLLTGKTHAAAPARLEEDSDLRLIPRTLLRAKLARGEDAGESLFLLFVCLKRRQCDACMND